MMAVSYNLCSFRESLSISIFILFRNRPEFEVTVRFLVYYLNNNVTLMSNNNDPYIWFRMMELMHGRLGDNLVKSSQNLHRIADAVGLLNEIIPWPFNPYAVSWISFGLFRRFETCCLIWFRKTILLLALAWAISSFDLCQPRNCFEILPPLELC